MSQKGDVAANLPPPIPVKGMGKGMGALLIALVCVGAFAGAGAGTYVTFRYVILPAFQGSNGNNNNNNNNCTTNCNNGGNTGCTTNCHSGSFSETSNSVTMTITQYGYSSNYFNFTFTVTSAETMNSFTVKNGSNTVCSGTAPTGQGTSAAANTPAQVSIGLSNNGCSSATFQTGTTYSWTFGDTNGDSFTGSQFNFTY
jgi:hypothetical protein